MAIKLLKNSWPDRIIEIKSIPITEGETVNTIKSLKNKKSTGCTNISSKVIKHCAIEISKSITYIFYNLQKEGT
jgi:hypothetical protein